jgi:hypothetical protein
MNLDLAMESATHSRTADRPGYVWIPAYLGMGFWIPARDYLIAKELATARGKIWLVAIRRDGSILHSTSRDALTGDGSLTGEIAWIYPEPTL